MRFSGALRAVVGAAALSLAVCSAALADDDDDDDDGGPASDVICVGCVDAGDIAAEAVTGDKIAPGAVAAEKMTDGAVTGEKLATGAVTGDKIADEAVTTPRIGPGAVTRDRIADFSVDFGKLDPAVVTAIQEGMDLEPVTIEVDCRFGESIQAVIDAAQPGQVTNIVPFGNCQGNILINKDDIVLKRGSGPGVGISGTVTIDGARRVGIENLPIRSPGSGIVAVNRSSFWLKGLDVSVNEPNGIVVTDGSWAVIEDSDISDNGNTRFPSAGITVSDGAAARIRNSQILRNDGHGISVLNGGFARVEDNAIEENGSTDALSNSGINIIGGAVQANGNRIRNNLYAGVRVLDGGTYRTGLVLTRDTPDNPLGFEEISAGQLNVAVEVARNSTADLRQVNVTGNIKVSNLSLVNLAGDDEFPNETPSIVDGNLEASVLSVGRLERNVDVLGECSDELGSLCGPLP